jgi:hypothetical protein
MKSKRGKITSFFTKNKSIKIGDSFQQNIFENFELSVRNRTSKGGTVIKVKLTKRDKI